MSMRRILLATASVFALSCGEQQPTRAEDQNAALGGEVAARVGSRTIPLSVVASVAEAQGVTAREAVRKLVDDEIAASAARAQGMSERLPVSWRLVTARARFAADHFREEGKRRGPPTDEEVRLLTELHWAEVDRPPTVRVIHAIVLLPKETALVASARAAADELQRTVAAASDDDFESTAKAFQHDPKLELRVEQLPAFTDDGWVAEGGGRMDETFAKAAFALPSPGATTGVVETRFGFHVIRLLARLPEKRMPLDERRVAFAEEVYMLRARDLMKARLDALRAAHRVDLAPGAEELMRVVKLSHDTVGTP